MARLGSMRSFRNDPSVLNQRITPGTAKRMFGFAVPHAKLLGLFLFVVIIDAAISVVNPLIYRHIINDGILKGDSLVVVRFAVYSGLLGIFSCILSIVQAYISAEAGARVVLVLRKLLFEHIQQMPVSFFMTSRTGSIVSRLNADVNGAQGAFTDLLSSVLGNMISVGLLLSAMFVLSREITLVSLVLLPVFILPARIWGRKLQQITRESYDRAAAMNSLMIERFNVSGALLVKLFGRPTQELQNFTTKAKSVSDIAVTRSVYGRLFATALSLVAVFSTAVAYGWGGVLASRHQLDLGTVIAFVTYLARLYGPLAGLSNIQINVMTALVSFERVFEVLDLKPMVQEKSGAIAIPPGKTSISFQAVSFRYPSPSEVSLPSLEAAVVPSQSASETVLHEITFTADRGQLVALVGPSGAGKTTITQLAARLYDPSTGSICINGVDLRDVTFESLHRHVGIVTQEAHLFHDSIRANLLYAMPEATEAQMYEALAAAQILRFVRSLPDGIDTVVGEHGYRFSGGEKQRIAIARLLLKAPEIVILDEATAHLDSESEAAIRDAFEIVRRGRTSIVIAHRLSTILNADLILVLRDGRVVERGSHAQLLQACGLYNVLYRLQFSSRNP